MNLSEQRVNKHRQQEFMHRIEVLRSIGGENRLPPTDTINRGEDALSQHD